jgi:hypothetical protein
MQISESPVTKFKRKGGDGLWGRSIYGLHKSEYIMSEPG